jgi:hypothetical protein
MFSRVFFHGSNFRSGFSKRLVPMFGSFVSLINKKCELKSGSHKLDIEPSILTLEIGCPHNTLAFIFNVFF